MDTQCATKAETKLSFAPRAHPTPQDAGRFHMRLAKGSQELEEVFRLRYDVFYREMGATPTEAQRHEGLDYDAHDEVADHLIVLSGGVLVGTYRMLPIRRLAGRGIDPYSEGEFDLRPFRKRFADNILELGRSCVHPRYRTGQVPRLLFAGVSGYMLEQKVESMIGCVSVHGASDLEALAMAAAFRAKGSWDARFDLSVKPAFQAAPEAVDAFSERLTSASGSERASALIPPLMKGYFNMGALVAGGPAADRHFHCHDFLMNLEVGNMKERYLNAFVKTYLQAMSSSRASPEILSSAAP